MNDTKNLVRQRKFIEEYARTLDIKGSMVAAGYPKQTAVAIGRKLLRNSNIRKELKACLQESAGHFEITKAYIISKYLKILDWAISYADGGAITEPVIAIRVLDALQKLLPERFSPNNIEENSQQPDGQISSIFNKIKGLDPNKI